MTAERFTITGALEDGAFLPWIARHARRLGLTARIESAAGDRIVLTVEGPVPMLDAMEMGCLLGPIEVWVDSIRRGRPGAADGAG